MEQETNLGKLSQGSQVKEGGHLLVLRKRERWGLQCDQCHKWFSNVTEARKRPCKAGELPIAAQGALF